MRDAIRVIVLGTGQMGTGIARIIDQKKGLELVGAYARRKERSGMDLAQALGLDNKPGIAVETDLQALIAKSCPELVIQATCSTLKDAEAEISFFLENAVNVISIAEEMTYPAAASPGTAKSLHDLAVRHEVSLLGTGINPGYVLDFLVLALTGVCSNVSAINAKRINDLSPYGPTVLNTQGVGLTRQEFEAGVADGSVTGHHGFSQSIQMIAARLGWKIDRIEETKEPIISSVRRETPLVTIEPGQAAGCNHTAVAYIDGSPVITFTHPQQVCPEMEGLETRDAIEIFGSPGVRFSGSPEIPGGEGTAALAVNMIPHVLNAAPGLYSMADLPIPSAILGDIRDMINAEDDHG